MFVHAVSFIVYQDGVRSALEYETQLQTLRSSLSFVEENHQSLFKSFADLESRVSKNGTKISSQFIATFDKSHDRECRRQV